VAEIHDPGLSPFERIALAAHYDRELFGQLVYENGLVLSGGLSGLSGRMTDGELRNAALELATTALAVYALLGSHAPLAAVRAHAKDRAEQLESKTAAA
jgi:hypothetical protein